MSIELKEGKIKIQLTKESFKDNLTDVILELNYEKRGIIFDGVKTEYYPTNYYYIKEVPEEFSITLLSNKRIEGLTYFCHGECYTITF